MTDKEIIAEIFNELKKRHPIRKGNYIHIDFLNTNLGATQFKVLHNSFDEDEQDTMEVSDYVQTLNVTEDGLDIFLTDGTELQDCDLTSHQLSELLKEVKDIIL